MEPKNFINRILESAVMLALAAYLIKSAAYWIQEVWPILLTIAVIIAVILTAYRIWRRKRDDLGKW